MPFPSSRIPGPSGRPSSKPSFLVPPTVGPGERNTSAASRIQSPVPQRLTKSLQRPLQQPRNRKKVYETSVSVTKPQSFLAVPSVDPSSNADAQSNNIRVMLRIRPSSGKDGKKAVEVAPDQRGVTLAPLSQQEKRFGFDWVFAESCEQDDIFQNAGRVAVENTIKGYNGSIFAYGQTGSGKTFTMLGASTADVHELRLSPLRGLTPRILEHLFVRLAALAQEHNASFCNEHESEQVFVYTLACSYLEIYNEKVFDLLEPRGSMAAQQPKSLREDRNKEVYVDQLREVPVKSMEDALILLQQGSQNRHISSTDMNRESSRSHAVFTVKLVLEERTSAGVKRTRRSCLHLVDLAGSEKQRQTRVQGKRLKEAAQINKSLSALGNVIMALVDVCNGHKRHVHYRDSKLTFLLRDALGGNAITSIVATIASEEKFFTETLSTLKFAQRAKFIKNNAVQNEDSDSLVPVLKEQIEKLLQEIATLRATAINSTSVDGALVANMLNNGQQVEAVISVESKAQAREKKKQNRWEPALEMMQKLLQASGAMAQVDLSELNEDERMQQERDVALMRCDRLELLLYRMICRFEEYKEVTFDPNRNKYGRLPQRKPSKMLAPRISMLPTPKRFGGAVRSHHQDNQEYFKDDEVSAVARVAAEKRERELQKVVAEQKHQIEELLQRSQEAEAENDLLRHELCELLEWKAFVEDEHQRASETPLVDSAQGIEGEEVDTPILEASTVPSEEMQGMQELLNVYRSLFDDVTELMYTKRPMLCSPPSPKSGSSVITDSNSTTYASGDEDEAGDDCFSIDGFNASEDGDAGVNDTYREARRVNALSSRLGRKLDQYQDAIQRLEKELITTQDELETSSAATKFAEFQLQQLRSLTADEETKETLELQKKLEDLEDIMRSQRDQLALALNGKVTEDALA
ncbi:hypothetical protein CCR75_004227 [Bremia lactucae]|uniref:Kinesin motor domain-containing protein n=1 Tax=Bremia lactucae TaxID=4779 RepID=A0A976FPZ8_BRELC|nr:hypothetical protein CCR75_004227 [Bremia lactucae]